MDKPYSEYNEYGEYDEYGEYSEYGEYNNSDTNNGTGINRGTLEFLLLLMIFLSCLPSFIQISKYCISSTKDYYKIKRIPIHKIKSCDDLLNDLFDNNQECSICLEEYSKNNKIMILNCNHTFHKSCLELWIKDNNTCPICRENII